MSGTLRKSASPSAELKARKLAPDPKRSALMARVRQKGTTPELAVRDILIRMGAEFRTNATELPGSPDIVSTRNRRALYVHGCFWHRHSRCAACTTPKRNAAFWRKKFQRNVERDVRKERQLRRRGFRVLTVWECQLKDQSKRARLERRLEKFFLSDE